MTSLTLWTLIGAAILIGLIIVALGISLWRDAKRGEAEQQQRLVEILKQREIAAERWQQTHSHRGDAA